MKCRPQEGKGFSDAATDSCVALVRRRSPLFPLAQLRWKPTSLL